MHYLNRKKKKECLRNLALPNGKHNVKKAKLVLMPAPLHNKRVLVTSRYYLVYLSKVPMKKTGYTDFWFFFIVKF